MCKRDRKRTGEESEGAREQWRLKGNVEMRQQMEYKGQGKEGRQGRKEEKKERRRVNEMKEVREDERAMQAKRYKEIKTDDKQHGKVVRGGRREEGRIEREGNGM